MRKKAEERKGIIDILLEAGLPMEEAEMLRKRAEERRIDEGLVVVMALTTYARERRLAV